MAGFALSIGLFVVYAAVGLAVLTLLHVRRHPLQKLLLAPGVGIGVLALSVFSLNRAGLPVSVFGPGLLAAGLIVAAGVALWLRPRLPLRQYSAFAGLILLGLLLTGGPMLRYGAHWVSYCNDDMANYCLGAQRFLHNPFTAPQTSEMTEGRDYSQYYWHLFVERGVRPGSELMLAWVASITGLTTLQSFMPLILSFYAALLSVTSGLAMHTRRSRRVALLACGLLVFSSMTTLGALYQLLAQVPGLSVLGACVAVVLGTTAAMSRANMLRHGLLLGVLLCSLLIVYPEVLLFLIAGTGFYLALSWWYGKFRPARLLVSGGVALLLVAVVFNLYLVQMGAYLANQVGSGSGGNLETALQFPFFLLPTGPANLWGVIPLGQIPDEPYLSAGIVAGAVLTLVAAVACLWMVPKRQPAAAVLFVMCGAATILFMNRQGFGLFKMSMFIQPFLCCVLAAAALRFARGKPWRLALPALVVLAGLPAMSAYLEASTGAGHAYNELAEASRSKMIAEYLDILGKAQPTHIIQSTDNPILIKLAALHTRGTPTAFPSENFFSYFIENADTTRRNSEVPKEWGRSPYVRFDLHDENDPGLTNPIRICYPDWGPNADLSRAYFIAPSGSVTILNKRRKEMNEGRMFKHQPLREVRNHLVPVSSLMAQPYYVGRNMRRVAQWQLEDDPCVPGVKFAALGRYLAFEVINPTPRCRLMLDLTASHHGFGDIKLPPVSVIGATRQSMAPVGSGSSRVVSPPVEPQWLDGRAYLVVDLGEEPKQLKFWRRKGLLALYGGELRTDRRWIVGWSRDLSLISEEEYEHLEPPAAVRSIRTDLVHPDLEYSGMCEDGWVGGESYFCLSQKSNHKSVLVSGMTVQLPGEKPLDPELVVLVDGHEVGRAIVPVGEFEYRFPAPAGGGRRKVELKFSKCLTLPKPDSRHMAAHIRAVGFDETPPK